MVLHGVSQGLEICDFRKLGHDEDRTQMDLDNFVDALLHSETAICRLAIDPTQTVKERSPGRTAKVQPAPVQVACPTREFNPSEYRFEHLAQPVLPVSLEPVIAVEAAAAE